MVVQTNLPELIEPRQVLRVDAILAAAGAFQNSEMAVAGFEFVKLQLEYIEGAVAGGAIDIRIFFSLYATTAVVPAGFVEWIQDIAFAIGAVAAGAETNSLIQPERITYNPLTVAREGFPLSIRLDRGFERIRVAVAESGQVATPGNCRIIAYGS